jgi:small nuclear ribonucleoprotein D3
MIGAPVKLLHEAKHHVVTVEMKSGEMFRGFLADAEDTMNVRLDDVTMFHKDGRSMPVEQVYLRGSQIRFVIVPSMFKNAPMFKRVRAQAKQRITQQQRDKYKKARDAIINAKQDKKTTLASLEQRNI